MKKIDYKRLIGIIIITILIGSVFSIFVVNNMDYYNELIKPKLSPPGILFPIVWTVLYILMGISYYITTEEEPNNNVNKIIYFTQLIVNSLWTLLFFGLELRLFSFIWIILLIALVIAMIINFYKINKTAAYLQIPYLLWITFASYLNLSLYILNK